MAKNRTIPNKPIPGTSTASFGSAPRMPRIGSFGHAPQNVQLRTLEGKFSSGVGVNWVGLRDVEALLAAAATIPQRTEQVMRELGERAITYAKETARWEDNTGMARGWGAENTDRNHLHYGLVKEADGTTSLYLAHGQTYGVYLEANPDYAILPEALIKASDLSAQVADKEIQRVLGRLAQ